jgi:DNA (cytosine-5)-methyltransferase 1
MVYGSVCSGIEAASVAWHPLGWRASFLSEIDAFPRAVLKHHYPDVPLHGDFTTIERGDYEPIDVLVGGTPCQSFSVAGLRGGLADERGNLALEYIRLAQRLRPRWLVWENVPGVLSSGAGRDFGSFLGGLVECGYGFAYRVLDAQYFGLAQRRKRVFVVGYLGDWRRAAAVLFEPESLRGHPAPRRETGERVADATGCGAAVSSGRGWWNDADVAATVRAQDSANKADTLIADTLRANGGSGGRYDKHPLTVTHTLRAEGHDAGEDGTGRGVPLVPVAFQANSSFAGDITADLAPTLRAMGHSGSHANAGGQVAVAFAQNQRDEVRLMAVAGALASEPGMKQQTYVQTVALRGREGGGTAEVGGDVATALRASTGGGDKPHILTSAVRRLTPREAARLQGFPDDYLDITYRGKSAADGPRYKALGNSFAVPVVRWLGQRIQAVENTITGAG